MDRQQLEKLSLQELQAELLKYRLPVLNDPLRCIDTLMSYFERHGPMDLLGLDNLGSGTSTLTSTEVTNAGLQQSPTALTEQIKLVVQLHLSAHSTGAQVSGAQIPEAQNIPVVQDPKPSRSPPSNFSTHSDD